MKVLIVPDTHGNDVVDYIKEHLKEYDKVVFLGDYFDSYTISRKNQLKSFSKIVDLNNEEEKVTLLIGNHDIHYMYKYNLVFRQSSGYSNQFRFKANALFNKTELYPSIYIDEYLFTHAGVNLELYNNIQKTLSEYSNSLDLNESIRFLFEKKHDPLFYVGADRGGSDPYSGIFWCDIENLINSHPKDIKQVVGHSFLKKIIRVGNNLSFLDTGHFCFLDTETNNIQQLELFQEKKLKNEVINEEI